MYVCFYKTTNGMGKILLINCIDFLISNLLFKKYKASYQSVCDIHGEFLQNNEEVITN